MRASAYQNSSEMTGKRQIYDDRKRRRTTTETDKFNWTIEDDSFVAKFSLFTSTACPEELPVLSADKPTFITTQYPGQNGDHHTVIWHNATYFL